MTIRSLAVLIVLIASRAHAIVCLVEADPSVSNPQTPWTASELGPARGVAIHIGDGRLITPLHVVTTLGTTCDVTPAGADRALTARVTAVCDELDVALLQATSPSDFKYVPHYELADLTELRRTAELITIAGDCEERRQTVRVDMIVSAVVGGRLTPVGFLDTAANAGNSGGAIVSNHAVVGMITANFSEQRAGFVLAEDIQQWLDLIDPRADPRQCPPRLTFGAGLSYIGAGCDSEFLASKGVNTDRGFAVLEIPDGYAGSLELWDVITMIDGAPIDERCITELPLQNGETIPINADILAARNADEHGRIRLTVLRDGAEIEITEQLEQPGHMSAPWMAAQPFDHLPIGPLVLGPVTRDLLESLNSDQLEDLTDYLLTRVQAIPPSYEPAVVLLGADTTHPWEHLADIPIGAPLRAINGREITSMEDVVQAIANSGEWITVSIRGSLPIHLPRESVIAALHAPSPQDSPLVISPTLDAIRKITRSRPHKDVRPRPEDATPPPDRMGLDKRPGG